MNKLLITAAAVSMGLALACGSTFAADKTLAERHGSMWPKSAEGFVTKDQCLKCHGPYDKLAKQTAKLEPNPHFSHLGAVNCEDCHKAREAKPQLMCNSCHQFKIKEKKAK